MRLPRHLVLLLLLFPSVAFADAVSVTGYFFGNTGGTATFNPTTDTLSLTSTITMIVGSTRFDRKGLIETGNDLGTITLTLGPLISGNVLHNAVFDGGVMSIVVDTTFSTAQGTLIPFTLNATLAGPLIWWEGRTGDFHFGGYGYGTINGLSTELEFYQVLGPSGTNQYNVIQGGTAVPEPSTVVLIMSGLGFVAWRTKSRRRLAIASRGLSAL